MKTTTRSRYTMRSRTGRAARRRARARRCRRAGSGTPRRTAQPRRPAIAFANVVLPVPGGPKRITADAATTPWRRASSRSASGRMTRRSMSSFSRSIPPIAGQRSPGGPGAAELLEPLVGGGRVEAPLLEVAHAVLEVVARRLGSRDRRLAVCGRASRSRARRARCRRRSSVRRRSAPTPRRRDSAATAQRSTQARCPSTRAATAPTTRLSRGATSAGCRAATAASTSASENGDSASPSASALPEAHGLLEPRVVELADLHAAGGVPDRRLHPQRLATRIRRRPG